MRIIISSIPCEEGDSRTPWLEPYGKMSLDFLYFSDIMQNRNGARDRFFYAERVRPHLRADDEGHRLQNAVLLRQLEARTGITKPRRIMCPAGSFFRSIFLFGVNLGVNGQKQKAKRPESLEISSLFTGAVGGIRTLARFNPPTPLAGEPLEPLGYYCKCIKINCCYSVVMFKVAERVGFEPTALSSHRFSRPAP